MLMPLGVSEDELFCFFISCGTLLIHHPQTWCHLTFVHGSKKYTVKSSCFYSKQMLDILDNTFLYFKGYDCNFNSSIF